MKPKVTAIVLAAGKGSRMQNTIPKQYLPLAGKPVLFYPLCAFAESKADAIVVVTGEGEEEFCRNEIIKRYGINKIECIITGGKERYDSVYKGLLAAKGADYVLIHDGARPLISVATIDKAIEEVKQRGACVVGMPVKDTIQLAAEDASITETPPRSMTWMAQTPQCFSYAIIESSYRKAQKANDTSLTDDAMAVRKYSNALVYLIEGSYHNIKVTTPEDIAIAETLLRWGKDKNIDVPYKCRQS